MALLAAGELSQTIRGQLRARDWQPRAEVRGPAHLLLPGGSLPGSDPGTLARRGAVRRFTGDPVPLADLTGIIERARHAERVLWPADVHGAIRYTILFAANRIAGLVPGLYLADEQDDDGSGPRLVSDNELMSVLRAAYGDAPCLVFVCANFAAARHPGGPGYGPLLIRAGTLGHAVWLSAIDAGLGGCVYGAPHHRVTDIARWADDDWSRHVFTAALGVPAQEGPGQ